MKLNPVIKWIFFHPVVEKKIYNVNTVKNRFEWIKEGERNINKGIEKKIKKNVFFSKFDEKHSF